MQISMKQTGELGLQHGHGLAEMALLDCGLASQTWGSVLGPHSSGIKSMQDFRELSFLTRTPG